MDTLKRCSRLACPSCEIVISCSHPLTHQGQTSLYTADRVSCPAFVIVIVKMPLPACGFVTVRDTATGGCGNVLARISSPKVEDTQGTHDAGNRLRRPTRI